MGSTRLFLVALALAVALGGVALLAFGPLSPPAGPVSPTAKTLGEVEPRIAINGTNTPGDSDSLYRITQPGSYYLTGGINGVTGKSGIEIVTSNVTIDLNGFELVGVPGSLSGITTSALLTSVEVRNGTVRSWGNTGVYLWNVERATVTDIRSYSNTHHGIAWGSNGAVRRCIAGQNLACGYISVQRSMVEGCIAQGNGEDGYSLGAYSTVSGCSAVDNIALGYEIGFNGNISGCTAADNASHGFGVGPGTLVTGCTASVNDGHGVQLGSGCTASNNVAYNNLQDGFRVGSNCLVLANTSLGNSWSGIRTDGNQNRVEGNNCTASARGIEVRASRNIIVRNTCSANTTANWDVVAGNVILVVNGTLSGGFAGSSGGVAPGSTDPSANFTY